MLKETIKKLLDWISDKGNRILIWLLGQKPACASFFQRGLPISRLNKEEKKLHRLEATGAFTATKRYFLNPRGAYFATQGLPDRIGRKQKSAAGLDLKIRGYYG